jgi:CheY-like chemotaxis protein/anti-sigma regulatory factor (Ser/Thr protein kinase)
MATVLVVDDSPVDRRLVGGLLARAPNLEVQYAADGDEALELFAVRPPQLVLTDLIMPNMDGMELVTAIVERYPRVPVILMTGKGSEEIAVKALQAGAASYVPKSALSSLLVETVENVLAAAAEEETQVRLMDCMTGCQFEFRDNDASMIPVLINYLRRILRQSGLCDETNSIRACVALEEALNNALYHGNLEIASEVREGNRAVYRALVEQRRQSEPFRSRKIYIDISIKSDEGRFVIRDEGPGFDPRNLPDPTDPANLERPSGRGLLLMRTFMDQVHFNEIGNQVTLIKRQPPAKASLS